MRAKPRRIETHRIEGSHRLGKILRGGAIEERARRSLDDALGRTTGAKGNTRRSARGRLERHQTEILDSRDDDGTSAREFLRNFAVAALAEKVYRRSLRPTFECGAHRPIPDDTERQPRNAGGIDGEIDAFVRQQTRDDEKALARRARFSKTFDIDRWVKHVEMPAVIALGTLRRRARVRNHFGRALRRTQIPPHQRTDERTGKHTDAAPTDVRIVIEEKAAHRMEITEMNAAFRNANAFRPRRRRTEDRVVAGEIKSLERARIKWRVPSKMRTYPRHAGEPGTVDGAPRKPIAGPRLVVKRGIDRRVGERRSERREDAFRSAALIEIVVDECELQEPLPSLPCTTAMVGCTR